MSLRSEHKVLLAMLSPDEWREVPQYTLPPNQEYVQVYRRRYRIGGREARLRELLAMGYIHVRTANFSPWSVTGKSDPHPRYERVQWQAILTPQGLDIQGLATS